MLRNLSLKAKLLSLSIGMSIALLVVGGIGYFALTKTVEVYSHVVDINFANFRLVTELRDQQRQVVIALSTLMDRKNTRQDAEEKLAMVEKAIKARDEVAKIYEGIPFTEGEDVIWNRLQSSWGPFKEMSVQLVKLSMTGRDEDFKRRDELNGGEFLKLRKETLGAQAELLAFHEKETDKWQAMAKAGEKSAIYMVTGTVIIGFFLSLLIGYSLASSLARILGGLAGNLSMGANQVASAANQISSTSQTLSSAATEQASSIEETAASLQELGGMVERNLKNAEDGVKLSEDGKTSAERGSASMHQLVESMKEILESNKRIERLVKVIEEVGEKTAVIDEIVFQTKLLSFNASVEAERAGEHGRGFAVVAQEVGNLAQMSGKAATEISNIVKTSVKDAQEIATENREKVERGNAIVQAAAEILGEIQGNSEKVTSGSSQIVSASREQANGIRQINKAMDNLNQTTQQTAAHSEEAAGAGEELTAQAEALNQMVSELNAVVYGPGKNQTISKPVDRSGPASSPTKTGPGKVTPIHAHRKSNGVHSNGHEPAKKVVGLANGNGHASEDSDDAWENL